MYRAWRLPSTASSRLWSVAGSPVKSSNTGLSILNPRCGILHKRHGSAEAGDHDSGHIEAGPNEGILFFDNLLPLKARWLFRFSFPTDNAFERLKHQRVTSFDPVELIKKSLPEDAPMEITGVIPRLKDGGAFVRFTHQNSTSTTEIESQIRQYLRENPIRPWWNPWHRVNARLVRGRPWVEDLYRPPSCRLRVEFLPSDDLEARRVTQEQLYSLFRPYGKLHDIHSQPSDSNVMPKYSLLDFGSVKFAIMAKNCLHGINVRSEQTGEFLAKLKLSYEQQSRSHWIRDWVFNHPRIVIPLLAAFGTILAYTVFDPIRTFNIRMHITRAFHLEDSRIYRWFASRATNILTFRRRRDNDAGMEAVFEDRKDNIEQIKRWLMENADTFIVVQGPRGSGKRELVLDHAIKNRKDKLVLDCKPIQEARTDTGMISTLATQVGYRPLFTWMNSINNLVDIAAQGAAGIKTGFSETLDAQFSNILNNTAAALKQIGLQARSKQDKAAYSSDDEYLEAHPERRPIVVIDNFMHKSQDNSIVYDKIAEWAANITSENIAHVIFLTTDVSFSKSLAKALPDRVFRQLSLSDARPEIAKRFVISHLELAEEDDTDPTAEDDGTGASKRLTASQKRRSIAELDESIAYLGGRLTDLEFLARRIKAGETPKTAVKEIIDQSASEILKMYILGAERGFQDTAAPSNEEKWTPVQAWVLIKSMADAKDGTLRYNEITQHSAFSGSNPDRVLQSLEQAELIALESANGRPTAVHPGKPVYHSAFKLLTQDRVLSSKMDLMMVGAAISSEVAGIEKSENELSLLAQLPKQPAEVGARVQYLLNKIQAGQQSIDSLETQSAKLKKVLSTEF